MPNIASAFKGEILRLSKKTARQQLGSVRSATAAHRKHIAALRKQVSTLEREVALLRRAAFSKTSATTAEASTPTRFVAKGLASLRARLGVSADEFGKLVGVSGVSVYNWEHKKAKPKPALAAAIAALRGIGKREARARLENLAPTKTTTSKAPTRQRKKRK